MSREITEPEIRVGAQAELTRSAGEAPSGPFSVGKSEESREDLSLGGSLSVSLHLLPKLDDSQTRGAEGSGSGHLLYFRQKEVPPWVHLQQACP